MHPLIEKARIESRHLLEPEALKLLQDYAIPVPEHRFVHTERETIEAARVLGWPVALKVVSPEILHKTEVNGVLLNLRNEPDVAEAFSRLTSLQRDGRRIEGLLVYPFQPHDIELFAGMLRDAQFGPVITFGLGGIWIEAFRDVAYGIAPLSLKEAEEMIQSIQGASILSGIRGRKPADLRALGELLARLSRMVLEEPEIREIDLNPVFPLEKGFFIADARVIL